MKRLLAVATGIAIALTSALATAQSYPNKPIQVIIPYAPGGSTDVIGRALGESMARNLKEPVVIENSGGAGGTIGTARVVNAQANGYMLLFHNMGIATAPALYKKLNFDSAKDLEPVGQAADVPMILVGTKGFAPSNLKEVIAHIKQKQGSVRFGHAGIGSTSHLCAMLLAKTLGTEVTMVPYRGTGPALQDLLAGQVDLLCDQPVATGPYIRSGMLKPYALAAASRLARLPDVPTFAEAGLPNFELEVWHGLYAPKGTPTAVIERLNQALRFALADPAVLQRFGQMGVTVPTSERQDAPALGTRTKAEIARWTPVIKAAGVYAE
ncbi:tripartite tricarboxylate transporter substrate-binding protein [Cupriavidus sp. RAF12]|uniref:tripartite tricarboxylate transporter substrate-binding protein n=1 Tax=Cupriavidus sp. RAF12 TaxID=3233050 RepID=UPI003F915741